jgi:hypothetical protein
MMSFTISTLHQMRWAAHVARTKLGEKCIEDFGPETERNRYSEEQDADGKIILEWILGK